jgi:hypothetical protein
MLEKVEEAVGGEGMKSLHDKLKKMQVRALLLHFIRILPRRSGRRQRDTNEVTGHDTLLVLADESCGQGERARRQERTAGRPHGGTGAAGERNEEVRAYFTYINMYIYTYVHIYICTYIHMYITYI